MKSPCLDTKVVRPYAVETDFAADDVTAINDVFNAILNCYNYIVGLEEDSKVHAKIAKKLITRTHLVTVTPLVKDCLDNGVSVETMSQFFMTFFNGRKGATNDVAYNSHCASGSGHEQAVKVRLSAVNKAWDKFLKDNTAENGGESVA